MMTYSLGFAIIKYIEGFVFIPGFGGEYLSLHPVYLKIDAVHQLFQNRLSCGVTMPEELSFLCI